MAKHDRVPLMAGNWKMNLNHLEAVHLVQKLAFSLGDDDTEAVEVVVLPPFTDLRSVQTLVDGDRLRLGYGAQDLSVHASGAYTGEVSGAMLAKLGCTYVVVGHSERREYHAETDDVVAAKVAAAIRHGLVPILCVGEREDVRDAGAQVQHCTDQMTAGLSALPEGLAPERLAALVVAYEPVWAIGTGRTATGDDAQEVCEALRARLAELHGGQVAAAVRVLYGGSMKPQNVAELMARPDVDGGLVGGASLTAEDFAAMVKFRKHITA
jgi:triosephosphate isomerase